MTAMITLPDGRQVSYADHGAAEHTPVLWCHGGPGNRLEPLGAVTAAAALGLRLIGVDRPGYGESDAVPGRDIGDWPADALAVADHLGLDQFLTVGVSTGGAYALALAAASRRAIGAVACCAVSDLRWREGRDIMPASEAVWSAPDRASATVIAEGQFGHGGANLLSLATDMPLPPADMAFVADPAWAARWPESLRISFAQGVAGFVDDRIADGRGWGSFDPAAIVCPVIVLHGADDTIVPLAHGQHTARIVPGARCAFHPGLGHFSITGLIPSALAALRTPSAA